MPATPEPFRVVKLTVTLAACGPLRKIGNTSDVGKKADPSKFDTSPTETLGAGLLSTMVPPPAGRTIVALFGVLRTTLKNLLPPTAPSLRTVTVMVASVWPGAKVTVPVVAV